MGPPPVLWTAYGRATSRRSVCVHRQGELKCGTVGYVCRGPQPAAMGFHDRTANRESHTHAAGFGGEEGIEEPVCILGRDPDAAIRHTYEHSVCLVLAGMDHQFARSVRDRLHGFQAIHHQIDNYLLQLDPITQDHWYSRCQLRPQRHLVADQLTLHQRDDLPDDVINVEWHLLNAGLVRERPDAPDHVTCPIAFLDDPIHRA